jgi:hypothetical protein
VDYIEIEGAIPLAPRGATLPYYEIEAENANSNGKRIGPSRDLYQLPTEASGRLAVQISSGFLYNNSCESKLVNKFNFRTICGIYIDWTSQRSHSSLQHS